MFNKTNILILAFVLIFSCIVPTNISRADSLNIESTSDESNSLNIYTKEQLNLFLSSMDRKENFDFKTQPIAKIKDVPIYADYTYMEMLKIISEEHWNHFIINNFVGHLEKAGKSYSEIAYAMNNKTNSPMELEIKDSILQHLILKDLVKNKVLTNKEANNLLSNKSIYQNKEKIINLISKYETDYKNTHKATDKEISEFIDSKDGRYVSYSIANYESLEKAQSVEAKFNQHLNPDLITFDSSYTGIIVDPTESRDFDLSYYKDIDMNMYKTLRKTKSGTLSKPFSPDGIMYSLIYKKDVRILDKKIHYKEVKEYVEDEKYAVHLDKLWNESKITYLIPNALKTSDRISMILTRDPKSN